MGPPRRYSWVDLLFSVVGACTFVLDWCADAWACVELQARGERVWSGLLGGAAALGSGLVQMFSWAWLQYDRGGPGGGGLLGESVGLCGLLHLLQLGFLCR